MDLVASHARHLERDAELLLLRVEAVFGLVRQPLLERLRKHRAFLSEHIEADPAHALAVYGASSCGTSDACGAIRDDAMSRVDRLISSLTERDPAAVRRFVGGAQEAIRAGLALCSELRRSSATALTPEQEQVALTADTAFSLQRYFLEILERSLDSLKPRSAVAVRLG